MLQWLYTYVANVCPQCFICVFRRMLQVRLSECCICFTHMLQVFYLNVVYVAVIFKRFFKCFYKFFRSMFQVFHMSSDVYCEYYIWMFQK
jgi:hypothetical protein